MNIASLAVDLKVGAKNIILYLEKIGYKPAHLNTKLSEILVEKIRSNFDHKETLEENQSKFVLTENIFSSIIQKIYYKGEKIIESHFTDEQAKEICSKMAVGKIRHYSNLFIPIKQSQSSLNFDYDLLKYQIHYLSEKARDFYGGIVLTFIYRLKHLPIQKRDVEVLYTNKKWYKNEEVSFPTFQLSRSNKEDNYYIRFTKLLKRKEDKFPIYTLLNQGRKKVGTFSRNGELIEKFKERFPSIIIFKEILNGKLTLYSGYDSGFCDICGKELNDALSVSYGRGPMCRKDFPID